MCFENVNDLDAFEEKMGNLKPWQRPTDYRYETNPDWYRDYPLHALVEFVKAPDWPTTLDNDDLNKVDDLLHRGRSLDQRDGEGYTVWDYVEGRTEIEGKLRKCEKTHLAREERAAIESETHQASAVGKPRRI